MERSAARVDIRNTDPVYAGFVGTFVYNNAHNEWTAEREDYKFVSAPLSTSSSVRGAPGVLYQLSFSAS